MGWNAPTRTRNKRPLARDSAVDVKWCVVYVHMPMNQNRHQVLLACALVADLRAAHGFTAILGALVALMAQRLLPESRRRRVASTSEDPYSSWSWSASRGGSRVSSSSGAADAPPDHVPRERRDLLRGIRVSQARSGARSMRRTSRLRSLVVLTACAHAGADDRHVREGGLIKARPPTDGFADGTYNGLNAFLLVGATTTPR